MIVQHLLEEGAKVNICDKDGFSLLCYPSVANNASKVKFLHQNRADVNIRSKRSYTPLYVACQNDNVYFVKSFT